MDIFDKYTVVDEQRCTIWHKNSCFMEVTQFATLKFFMDPNIHSLEIKDIAKGSPQSSDVPLAQIVLWGWNERGEQQNRETKILNWGGTVRFGSVGYHIAKDYQLASIIIRFLKKRERANENPCPPLSSPDDDLAVHIGDKKITVSAHWLMSVSPVIHRMLSVEMREKQQRSLTLDELGIDMELFSEFLEAISPNALHSPILPNPKNVLVFLKLADFFQVNGLKLRCDLHLTAFCVEIPLIDRLLLIDRYRLEKLQSLFVHMEVQQLRAFFKANQEQMLQESAEINKNLLIKLTARLC